MNKQTNEHAFSIELTSKRYVSFEQSKDVESTVLVEGTLGDFISLNFVFNPIILGNVLRHLRSPNTLTVKSSRAWMDMNINSFHSKISSHIIV